MHFRRCAQVEGLETSKDLKLLCSLLDITAEDLLGLFKLLDVKQDGVLSVESFVLALFKCQSSPQGVDMVRGPRRLARVRSLVQQS